MRKNLLKLILYTVALLTAFLSIQSVTHWSGVWGFPQQGKVDLREIDFLKNSVALSGSNWEYYPEQFYTPADFESGMVSEAETQDREGPSAQYGTHRVRITLPVGETYAVLGKSFLNSQRLYVNGELVGEVGSPGTTKQETIPKARQYFYAFTPLSEETELIFHVANFYIKDGGGRFPLLIGVFENIARIRFADMAVECIIVGCLFTAFLYYMGMYLFSMKRRHYFHFATMCLMMAVRNVVTGDKLLMELFPAMSFNVGYALEYLSMVFLLVCFVFYIKNVFHKFLPRAFMWPILGFCAAYGVIILCTEPIVYTQMVVYFNVMWVLALTVLAVLIIRYGIRQRPREPATIIMFAGLIVICVGALNDLLFYFSVVRISALQLNNAMLVCIFLHMVAMNFDVMRTEEELLVSRVREKELYENNRLLDRLGRMKTEFLASISHEMKTPLTVMSVNAQMSKAMLNEGEDKEEISRTLDTITAEAMRLSRMVSNVLELGNLRENHGDRQLLEVAELLEKTAAVCETFVKKHGNTLEVLVPENLPLIQGSADRLTQVLVNLLSNAAAYTKNGTIMLCAKAQQDVVEVWVSDTGEGIAQELLLHVFERRITGSADGEGLGLFICKEIVEEHGGEITIENMPQGGCKVSFTIPIAQ